MPNSKKTVQESQEICIDLPGESVQCWRSSKHVKIVLKKHRDLIFNIKRGMNNVYTIESSESDYYNVRDKKLISAKNKEKISFKDGEKLHLWIARDFKGFITVKQNGTTLLVVEPAKLDPKFYDNSPQTKPAPIIVNLEEEKPVIHPVKIKPDAPIISPGKKEHIPAPIAASAPAEECSIICVVEGNLEAAPEKILDHFKSGSKADLIDIDFADVITRNWLYGQLAGTAAYAADNWNWLKASLDAKTSKGFQLVRIKAGWVKGKIRFYYAGYSKYNTFFGPGGFGPKNDRVMNILAGAGSTSSSFAASVKGVIGSFKGFALVSLIFGSATSVAEWKADAQKDGYDLTSTLLMSIVKTVVVAVLTALVVAAVVTLALAAGTATVPVIVIGGVTIAAGFAINYLVEATDKGLGRIVSGDETNSDGMSAILTPHLRKAGAKIADTWEYLMQKFPNDYKEILF